MNIYRRVVIIRNAAIGFLYQHLLRPIFFAQDPERVHDRLVHTGRVLQRSAVGRALTRTAFGYTNRSQAVEVAGLRFPNPIGLAAGFDKHADLTGLMVPKGSVAIDGVSLTLVDVQADAFSVALIPTTLRETTLGDLKPGDKANIETDVIGKYVKKYLQGLSSRPGGVTLDKLREEGFI